MIKIFLDEFPKNLQKNFMLKDFVAGWQNKKGKVKIMIIGTSPEMAGTFINRKTLSNSHQGKLLWNILKQATLDQEIIYMTNLIKYPLLNIREPTKIEIKENKPLIDYEIEFYKPVIVICLGKYTMSLYNLHTYQKKIINEVKIISINHPGYYLRKPNNLKTVIDFLKEETKTNIEKFI